MFSCPWISSRVIVIIQARSGCCSVKKRLCSCLCSLLRYSELGTVCGWLYTALGVVSRQGAVFPILSPTIGSEKLWWGKQKKSPRAVELILLTTPRGVRLQPFKKSPPPTPDFSFSCQHPASPLRAKTTSDVYDELSQSLQTTLFCFEPLWLQFAPGHDDMFMIFRKHISHTYTVRHSKRFSFIYYYYHSLQRRYLPFRSNIPGFWNYVTITPRVFPQWA